MIESNPLEFSLEKIVKNALYEDLGQVSKVILPVVQLLIRVLKVALF